MSSGGGPSREDQVKTDITRWACVSRLLGILAASEGLLGPALEEGADELFLKNSLFLKGQGLWGGDSYTRLPHSLDGCHLVIKGGNSSSHKTGNHTDTAHSTVLGLCQPENPG